MPWNARPDANLVKRSYRVLLTRGMKGCYLYFEDEATRRHVEERVAARQG